MIVVVKDINIPSSENNIDWEKLDMMVLMVTGQNDIARDTIKRWCERNLTKFHPIYIIPPIPTIDDKTLLGICECYGFEEVVLYDGE